MKKFKSGLKFWRNMTAFWTVVLFFVIIWDFINNGSHADLLSVICAIYAVVLSVFSADKEFERWNDYHEERHPGEIYVIIWTVLVFGILFLDFAFEKTYRIPSEVIATYVVVLGILAVTRKSKSIYKIKHRK